MRTLLETPNDTTLFFQRLVLALVIGAHGLQKAFGWFGGYGFEGTMQFFTQTLHVPAPLALLVILGETLGVLGLVFGAGTRIAAAGVTASMLGAIAMVHLKYGFFMNWGGNQAGEGFELHLLALALSLPLLVRGAGAYAFDTLLLRFVSRPRAVGGLVASSTSAR
jgi:putative oxidoreductase